MARKIAPHLTRLVEFHGSSVEYSRRELHSLLAVIRVVEKQGPLVSAEWDMKLGRALARLDKVSGRRG